MKADNSGKEAPASNQRLKYQLALENTVQIGKYALELEEKRQESIIKQAGDMLTAFSVASAALLMVIPIILNYTTINSYNWLVCIGVASIPLIISLLFSVFAEWRYDYYGMHDAEKYRKIIFENINKYPSQDQYNYLWIDQLTNVQKSISRINDRRVILLKVSMISFLLAIVVIVASTLVLLFI